MRLSQFMDAYGWESLISFLIGLATGALTSYAVTDYFKRQEERDAIIQRATDFSNECHIFLDLTNKLIEQLALRKYYAYRIIQRLRDLDGEAKRRTRNEETIRQQLSEISKETLNSLCVATSAKNPGARKIRKGNRRRLYEVLNAVDACIESANELCLGFGEITDLHYYVSNIEYMADMRYDDFIETLEREECKQYKGIFEGRDKLKKTLFDLVSVIKTTRLS
jgi:hypothetical protein